MATANVFPQSVAHPWPSISENTQSIHLLQKVTSLEHLLEMQAAPVRQLIEQQAQELSAALIARKTKANFRLPGQVVCYPFADGQLASIPVPERMQKQSLGGWMSRVLRQDSREVLIGTLNSLEQSSDPAVANSAGLLRYAIARYIVRDLLPAGRPVSYISIEGEEIPSVPCFDEATDELDRELSSSYGPYARRFFLPEWISFDEKDCLLVDTAQEADHNITLIQNYLSFLQDAARIAPYIVADKEYQRKRYGILGQLVNQGRSLGRYWTADIIRTIQRRASSGKLDRGLTLHMPFFDDRELVMKMLDFVVVPTGWTMFMPAFIVRAARVEQAKAIRNPSLSFSTRKHLLLQLDMLEQAFQAPHSLNPEFTPEIS